MLSILSQLSNPKGLEFKVLLMSDALEVDYERIKLEADSLNTNENK